MHPEPNKRELVSSTSKLRALHFYKLLNAPPHEVMYSIPLCLLNGARINYGELKRAQMWLYGRIWVPWQVFLKLLMTVAPFQPSHILLIHKLAPYFCATTPPQHTYYATPIVAVSMRERWGYFGGISHMTTVSELWKMRGLFWWMPMWLFSELCHAIVSCSSFLRERQRQIFIFRHLKSWVGRLGFELHIFLQSHHFLM